MPPVSRKKSQSARLRAAMQKEKLGDRQLARLLVGPEADGKVLSNKKSQVSRWRRGVNGIEDANAELLASALRYPADAFKRGDTAPRSILDDLKEDMRDQQRREIRRLGEELRAGLRVDIRDAVREALEENRESA